MKSKSSPLPRCPECYQLLAHYGCSGEKGFYPNGGCHEPEIFRLEKTEENVTRQRLDPDYQQELTRLIKRQCVRGLIHVLQHRLLTHHQNRERKTGENLNGTRQFGWVIHTPKKYRVFPTVAASYLHALPDAELGAAFEGVRQVTLHIAPKLTRKTEQTAIRVRSSVQALQQQLTKAGRPLESDELDRAISELCLRGPLRGAESWIKWLVLNGIRLEEEPWRAYPWSIQVTQLTMPNRRQSVTVEALISLRP